MRYDFKKHTLDESSVNKNPFQQFNKWYAESVKTSGVDASAMTLASAADNKPSARTVYLRGFDSKGFCFYTNYNSRKGKELSANHNTCLLFFWHELQRQIIIEGKVQKLSAEESDNYFAARPRGSQIGAWASQQSSIIQNRKVLEDRVKKFTQQFEGKKIPRPPHWGGYRLIPSSFEFWQGRESRLHDRIQFTKGKNGKWKMERLSP